MAVSSPWAFLPCQSCCECVEPPPPVYCDECAVRPGVTMQLSGFSGALGGLCNLNGSYAELSPVPLWYYPVPNPCAPGSLPTAPCLGIYLGGWYDPFWAGGIGMKAVWAFCGSSVLATLYVFSYAHTLPFFLMSYGAQPGTLDCATMDVELDQTSYTRGPLLDSHPYNMWNLCLNADEPSGTVMRLVVPPP